MTRAAVPPPQTGALFSGSHLGAGLLDDAPLGGWVGVVVSLS